MLKKIFDVKNVEKKIELLKSTNEFGNKKNQAIGINNIIILNI